MRALRSWLGLALALAYALAFVGAYAVYARAGGQWPEAETLFLVALPYTLAMVKLAGTVDFSGESVASVMKGAIFCCALAYVAGALAEFALRLGFPARQTSAWPSMRSRFCTAAPDAPLPRLSNLATSTACRRARWRTLYLQVVRCRSAIRARVALSRRVALARYFDVAAPR